MKFQVRKNPESPLNPCENLKLTQTTPILSISVAFASSIKVFSENKIQIPGVQTRFTATSALKKSRKAVLGAVCLNSPNRNNSYTFKHVRDSARVFSYCRAEAARFPETAATHRILSSNSGRQFPNNATA